MPVPPFVHNFLKRFGFIHRATWVDIDPNLVLLILNVASREGITPNEAVNQLLSFALGEQHYTDENLALWDTLTNREKETAALICLGYKNQEIAQLMSISINTVRTHVKRVLRKFDVGSKAEFQLRLATWDFTGWDETDPYLDTAKHYYPDVG